MKIIFSEVMINTNDLISLKNCLLSMSKIALDKHNNNLNEILEKLVIKLNSSDNGYVHGAIGNYYLFNKKVGKWLRLIHYTEKLIYIYV